jgi:hypothetical protein
MPQISDQEFVNKVLVATLNDKIDWQPTAQADRFSASFGGKWTVLVTATFDRYGPPPAAQPFYDYDLTLRDSAGEQILRIDSEHNDRISELHELARRRALKVNEAIEDFMKELDEPQS